MTERVSGVNLKEAVVTGVILDFLLLAFSSIILDGGVLFSITLCLIATHWAVNFAVLLSKQAKQSPRWRDFIRFGLLGLILLALAVGVLLGLLGVEF